MATLLFILGIILFIMLVVVHELGHAIVAKRNGVVVEEFGIGFPPRAWKKKLKNGVLFTLNWLPLGGFVKLQGESDDSNKKGDYGRASLWAKTKILMAGVAMNWVVAALLFTILAWTGLPKFLPNEQIPVQQFTVASDTREVTVKTGNAPIADVAPNSPAAEIGLQPGDAITRVDGREINAPKDLVEATQANAGEEVAITYQRGDETLQGTTELRGPEAKGQLGAATGQPVLLKSTWSAPIVGVGLTAQVTWLTLQQLGSALGNLGAGLAQQLSISNETREQGRENISQAGEGVAGPVGIVNYMLRLAENAGLTGILFIIAFLSVSLALINTLPIPALDGGRLFVTLLFRGMKKKLTKPLEEKIHATGFMVLISLIIVITIVDIRRLGG